jgi:hypothetical protein
VNVVKVYIDQTQCFTETRIKEHHQHIWLYHLDKSAMAQHSRDLDQCGQFQDTRILAMKTGCMECITREAIKIELHPDITNRIEGFSLGKSRKLLLQTLKE